MIGIEVAVDGKDIKGQIAFTTQGSYLKLDVAHDPKLFDFVKYTFGSESATLGAGFNQTRELLRINHTFNYSPASIVYFYNYDGSYDHNDPTTYQVGNLTLTGAGLAQQRIWYTCDSQSLIVYYTAKNLDLSNPIAIKDLSNKSFGVKYFIFNNEL